MSNLHNELMKTAEYLAKRGGTRPKQVDLRRAISTAYYAMFHALCANNADNFISKKNKDGRAKRAWKQTYRALDHKKARQACKQCYDEANRMGFPSPIKNFANCFVTMQRERSKADYDPYIRYNKEEVTSYIESAKRSMNEFTNSRSIKHKQAFAALVLFKSYR